MQPIVNLIDRLGILVLFPVALLLGGLVIHLYTIFLLVAGRLPSSLWVWWVNIFMLVFDAIVFVGLLRLKKTAYLFAITGFFLLGATWITNSILERAINLSTAVGIVAGALGMPILVCAYWKLRNG